MIEVDSFDAVSTIKLLEAIEALYPLLALIHVFLDTRVIIRQIVRDGWRSRGAGSAAFIGLLPL